MPRFLLKRAIALWFILSATFLMLMMTDSNQFAHTPFASIEIQPSSGPTVYLPNRIFDCTSATKWRATKWQCSTALAEQLLELEGYNPQPPFCPDACSATYAGRTVSCRGTEIDHMRGLHYRYALQGDLGLSAAQLDGLRWQYWGKNLLMSMGELGLTGLGLGLSLVGGVLVALGAWRNPGQWTKGIASVACGMGMAVSLGLISDQIDSGGIDFIYVVSALALLGTLLATFWLYRQRPINKHRLLSFICGLGVFSIELLLVLTCLLWLGYVD
ncbi:hypothetical protein [Thermoleptolyngbya sp.]